MQRSCGTTEGHFVLCEEAGKARARGAVRGGWKPGCGQRECPGGCSVLTLQGRGQDCRKGSQQGPQDTCLRKVIQPLRLRLAEKGPLSQLGPQARWVMGLCLRAASSPGLPGNPAQSPPARYKGRCHRLLPVQRTCLSELQRADGAGAARGLSPLHWAAVAGQPFSFCHVPL